MGRREKKDVDYFPFYAKDGRTLHIIESKYQCKGTGFFTNVFRFLCLRPDHHFSISNEADKMWFFSETKCDEESGIDMLNIMAITGKIDIELWKHKIIASQDFLDSIKDAYKNRNNEIITIKEISEFYGITYHINTQDSVFPGEEKQSGDDVGVITSNGNTHTIRDYTIRDYTILKNIFEFWNEQKIIKHRNFEKFKPNINAALKNYSEEEIISAIKNYASVLHDDDCWWTHSWSIKDFLTRGMDRFCDDNFKLWQYEKKAAEPSPFEDPTLL